MSYHWRMYPRKDSERSTHLTHTFPAFTKDPLVPVGPILVAAQSTEPSISGLLSRCIQTPWQGKDALVGAWDAGPIPSTL